jgi:hypothetical protein
MAPISLFATSLEKQTFGTEKMLKSLETKSFISEVVIQMPEQKFSIRNVFGSCAIFADKLVSPVESNLARCHMLG